MGKLLDQYRTMYEAELASQPDKRKQRKSHLDKPEIWMIHKYFEDNQLELGESGIFVCMVIGLEDPEFAHLLLLALSKILRRNQFRDALSLLGKAFKGVAAGLVPWCLIMTAVVHYGGSDQYGETPEMIFCYTLIVCLTVCSISALGVACFTSISQTSYHRRLIKATLTHMEEHPASTKNDQTAGLQ